jgi:hypothetical protein
VSLCLGGTRNLNHHPDASGPKHKDTPITALPKSMLFFLAKRRCIFISFVYIFAVLFAIWKYTIFYKPDIVLTFVFKQEIMPQPKAHRYKKAQRLFHAKNWIKTHTCKVLHHGYAKHFGVSKYCAILELEQIGVEIDPKLKESLRISEEQKRIQREKRKAKKEAEYNFIESNEYFAYIAGYTSGGVPYGTSWEEYNAMNDCPDIESYWNKENDGLYSSDIEDDTCDFVYREYFDQLGYQESLEVIKSIQIPEFMEHPEFMEFENDKAIHDNLE